MAELAQGRLREQRAPWAKAWAGQVQAPPRVVVTALGCQIDHRDEIMARVDAPLEADLGALLTEHQQFVARLAAAHDGRIVKPEGDGFWVVFPSVTAAAPVAMGMQEELRLAQPNKGDERLAMHIVLTLS
jgi:class 3 adenylate cyclase